VLKWQSTIAYDGDRSMVTPPTGGIPTTTFFNADGQTTEVRHHLGATTAAPYQTTSYSYDRQGRQTQAIDPAGNTWTTGYDVGGRTTTITDPDTGTTTSTYNAAGDVLTTTDARPITLAHKYDDLGRKTELWQDAVGTGTKRASWDYDTLAGGGSVKGLLVKSTRWVGSAAYSSEITSVDDG
jgi:YD repeat-containing protein